MYEYIDLLRSYTVYMYVYRFIPTCKPATTYSTKHNRIVHYISAINHCQSTCISGILAADISELASYMYTVPAGFRGLILQACKALFCGAWWGQEALEVQQRLRQRPSQQLAKRSRTGASSPGRPGQVPLTCARTSHK